MTVLAAMPKYEAYKDSGVDYLPSIPTHWNVRKTKYVAKLYPGLSGKAGNDFSKEPVEGFSIFIPFTSIYGGFTVKPVYQYVSIGKFEIQNKVENGDILFLMSSETFDDIAKCAIFQDSRMNIYLNSFCKGLRVFSSQVDNIFVNYLFKSDYYRDYFAQSARGFTRINLKQEYIYNSQLPIPPLQEQTTIANFLDKKTAQIDEAIAIKQKQIALLKERKQILIQKAVTQGLGSNVPLHDSGLDWIGNIPEHWELLKLKHLFKEVNKRTKTGEETLFSLRMVQGLVPHDSVSDKEISNSSLIDYKIVERGQLVMNRMRAAIGIFGVAKNYGLVSPDYAIFNIKITVNADYFLRLFKTSLMGTQFRLNSKGLGTGSSGFMRLYTESFGDIKIPFPSVDEQIEINKYIESQSQNIDDVINLQNTQIENLKEYKTTLINSAVTGKIKIAGNTDDA